MADNNGRVTTREFYEKLHDFEDKVYGKLDDIKSNQAKILTIVETHEKSIDKHEGEIDELQKSNVRWTGVTGIIALLVSALVNLFFPE